MVTALSPSSPVSTVHPPRAPSRWLQYAAPQQFYPLAGRLTPWFATAAAALLLLGLYIGYVLAPTDRQQGDAYRIIYLHVPAA